MTYYTPKINKTSGFALIVRVDNDGQESVINGFKGRHFKTYAAAVKSTDRYLAKLLEGGATIQRSPNSNKEYPCKDMLGDA